MAAQHSSASYRIYSVEQATVYRAGGRRWFSVRAAIRAYANKKFREKHPCECEAWNTETGGYDCGCSVVHAKVMPRYIRWLRRADKKQRTHDDEELTDLRDDVVTHIKYDCGGRSSS